MRWIFRKKEVEWIQKLFQEKDGREGGEMWVMRLQLQLPERAANAFEEEMKDGLTTVVAELLCRWMLLFGASGIRPTFSKCGEGTGYCFPMA